MLPNLRNLQHGAGSVLCRPFTLQANCSFSLFLVLARNILRLNIRSYSPPLNLKVDLVYGWGEESRRAYAGFGPETEGKGQKSP